MEVNSLELKNLLINKINIKVNEFIEGESKDSTPKWPGISGIKKIFTDSRNEIAELDDTTANSLSSQREEVKSSRTNFEIDLYNQGINKKIQSLQTFSIYR